jgi:hypothetical protein
MNSMLPIRSGSLVIFFRQSDNRRPIQPLFEVIVSFDDQKKTYTSLYNSAYNHAWALQTFYSSLTFMLKYDSSAFRRVAVAI